MPIQTFSLNTVTYGTTSAPYLATRTLKQLAIDESVEFPRAAKIVLRDLYVDDMLTGVNNSEMGNIYILLDKPYCIRGTYNKIYVCIFICFVTRAIHLEIVSDLASDSFIATLKRFFSRRGKSAKLFTDNARTFIGAQAELKHLYNMVNKPDEKLATYLSSENIQWNFNPPRAPNFGGLWEAGVKSFKYHLKRVVGGTILTLEEFLTITNQIEGILNSRPISPLSVDPDDLEVLTPAHFLIGRSIDTIPDIDLKSLSDSRLSHWQRVTKMTQIIWKRWTNTYLNNLQQRNKWMIERDNIKIGTLVIIKEDNIPIYGWWEELQVFPGSDGKVRVVSVKTKNGTVESRKSESIGDWGDSD
ncbi:uncharacterized protein [Centruroides vittatus]|uniref:uncharacterized protein n=1 Tax=Centruroides vittatus TaxID=120091 RepID=UPI00350ED6B2